MSSRGQPFRVSHVDGFEILVGRGAVENDELTFRVANPVDVWLHAAGYSGSHVIIRNPDRLSELPREVVERAAQLAVWHSKAREARGKVEVHVCKVADVRKPRGSPAGQVQIQNWRPLRIYARDPDELA